MAPPHEDGEHVEGDGGEDDLAVPDKPDAGEHTAEGDFTGWAGRRLHLEGHHGKEAGKSQENGQQKGGRRVIMCTEQETADSRANHGAYLEQAGIPRHGIAEKSGRYQLWQECGTGRGAESL